MQTGKLDYVIETYRRAVNAEKSDSKTFTSLRLGMGVAGLYCGFTQEEKKAMRTWERIMNAFSSLNKESPMGEIHIQVPSMLAEHLLCAAIEVGVHSPLADTILLRLANIIKKRKGKAQSEEVWWIPASAPAVAWGPCIY